MGQGHNISVELIDNGAPLRFSVVVAAAESSSRHEVTADPGVVKQLSGGRVAPEGLVEAAFRFLLDREPKEAILGRFDITVIARYFPEFPRKIADYL